MEKYDVISVVGEGSYGLVMRCRHRESGQYVAIKKFLETEDDPTVKKMAMREIRMLKKLRHENLVNMIEVFRRKKRFFLVFEYLEHTVLEELEARTGGLGYVTSRKHIYQVLRALDFIHSNDVIHRDIKPENVLVSRLGVIKLCDFGFARPFEENETFTDYVATRWYRSPELLVGDPRYGKEVDIWATGCLYAEMMTGEPIFPGESDIDQLFQIVRVLGKLNSRHQILITRNAMFRGMKQEQNSSLSQLFPEWSRDSLDFLTQCLKMDTNSRPDTDYLLKHDLFIRDDFLDYFLPELKAKIGQEVQSNPLSRRLAANSGKKNLSGDDKHKTEKIITINKKSLDEHKLMNSKERIAQIGLSLLSSSQYYSNNNSNNSNNSTTNNNQLKSMSNNSFLEDLKNGNNNNTNKLKHLNISNLTFKDTNNNSHNNNNKYSRILSAKTLHRSIDKPLMMSNNHTSHNNSNIGSNNSNASINLSHVDANASFQPPSPVQFQSLQPDFENKNSRRNSPLSNFNNLTVNGNILQLLNSKRVEQQNINNNNNNNIKTNNSKHSPTPLQQLGLRASLTKRERGLILNTTSGVGSNLLLGTMNSINSNSNNNNNNNGNLTNSTNETSPRLLQPPPWLMGNVKITSQGKITQIGASKRGMTDWKTISNKNNNDNLDFLLPNCPGASTSPYRGLKKKLSPMSNHENSTFTHTQNSITSPSKNQN